MVFSKNRITIAAIWLLGLVAPPQVPAQETGGDVDSFNRSLGLEEMGADLTNVEQELAHGNPSGPAEGPKKVAVKQKRAPGSAVAVDAVQRPRLPVRSRRNR